MKQAGLELAAVFCMRVMRVHTFSTEWEFCLQAYI